MPSETTDTTPTSGGHIGRFALRNWVAIVVVLLAAILVAQNRMRIPVNVLWVRVTSPLWLLLTIIFLAGLLTGLLLHRRRR